MSKLEGWYSRKEYHVSRRGGDGDKGVGVRRKRPSGGVKDSKYWLLSFNKAEGVPAAAATWC